MVWCRVTQSGMVWRGVVVVGGVTRVGIAPTGFLHCTNNKQTKIKHLVLPPGGFDAACPSHL